MFMLVVQSDERPRQTIERVHSLLPRATIIVSCIGPSQRAATGKRTGGSAGQRTPRVLKIALAPRGRPEAIVSAADRIFPSEFDARRRPIVVAIEQISAIKRAKFPAVGV